MDVVSIALRVHKLSLCHFKLYTMLGLQLQVILFRLFESFAHLHVKFGVVDQSSLPQQALFVREAIDDEIELHRVILRSVIELLLAILVSYLVETPHVVALEVAQHIQTVAAWSSENFSTHFIIRLFFGNFLLLLFFRLVR